MLMDAGPRALTDLVLRQAQGEVLMLSLSKHLILSLSKYGDLPGWLEAI